VNTAENITRLRDSRGWSIQELADRAGLKRNTLSRWESGVSAKIPAEALAALAAALGVSVDELLTGRRSGPGARPTGERRCRRQRW
jgi:transcriptional regulator with XRE-family HTH domain